MKAFMNHSSEHIPRPYESGELMGTIRNPIIPDRPLFYKVRECRREFDLSSISVFAATGFFLDDDTYYTNEKVARPGHLVSFDPERSVRKQEAYFSWTYQPRDISFDQAVDEFTHLFEQITQELLSEHQLPVLPLSGGLDSRSQATALKGRETVSYSYKFEGGHPEDRYGAAIAKTMDYSFQRWQVPLGYLWKVLKQLSKWNGCYSEFTHPRQMAFGAQLSALPGDVFYLGHWGDVLFDDMGVPDDLPFDSQVDELFKKIVKKGGLSLGDRLWKAWALDGKFKDYLRSRLESLLGGIPIDNANARIRAFKSMYWAPRWTSVNLCVFQQFKPVVLPYYHDDMCRFICTVPERHLAGRKIQIAYIKRKAPELARIPWQAQRPFNLYSYPYNKAPWNLPYRVWDKSKRIVSSLLGKELVQRNWELQFLGEENDRQLRAYLFDTNGLHEFVPDEVIGYFYKQFKEADSVQYSHPVSMLLTLAQFWRMQHAH